MTSPPEWVQPYLHCGGVCNVHVHSLISTSGATHCDLLMMVGQQFKMMATYQHTPQALAWSLTPAMCAAALHASTVVCWFALNNSVIFNYGSHTYEKKLNSSLSMASAVVMLPVLPSMLKYIFALVY